MPSEEIDRVILNASLINILDGRNIDEKVKEAEEVLKRYANYADNVKNDLRTRQGSRYLEEQLSHADLETVGKFQGSSRTKRDYKIYSFQRSNQTVEFHFKRGDYDLPQAAVDMAMQGDRYKGKDLERAAFETVRRSHVTGKAVHHSEVMLGKDSRTLDIYNLEKVVVTKSVPRSIGGFIPWFPGKQKETVYTST
jgi:hypothetical protein